MNHPLIGDAIGIVGVLLIVIAYVLMQLGRMDPKKITFSLLNAVGAILILISLIYDWNLASFVMEVIWITLSLYGVYQAWRSRRQRNG